MKIYDIIQESQQLNEAVGVVLSTAIKYALPKGIGAIEHVLSWFAGRIANKPKAAEELAEAWVYLAEKSGMGIDEAVSVGSRSAKGKVADDVIEAAAKKAREISLANSKTIWGQLKTPDSRTNFWWGALWDSINAGLMFWGIVDPILDCKEKILNVYRMRDEGEKELQDDGKLQWVVQYYIDECVQRIVSIWLGNKIVSKVIGSWVPGIAYRIPLAGKLLAKLDPIYSKLPPVAQAGFKAWMISSEGQEALAKWIVGEAMIPGTDWKIPGGDYYKRFIINPLSGLSKTGYDAVLRKLGSDKAQPAPKDYEPPSNVTEPPDNYAPGLGKAKNPTY